MDAADNFLHNRLAPQRVTPCKTTYLSCPGSSKGRSCDFHDRGNEPLHMISPTRPAPPPPLPGFPRKQQRIRDENRRSVYEDNVNDYKSSDPASKIWAKLRRCSGISMSNNRRNISASSTASVTASVNLPFSATCVPGRRALRRKKTGATEGILMMQKQLMAGSMGSTQSLTDRTNLSDGDAVDPGKRRNTTKGSSKGRRSSGRWGFGNWWLNV